MNKKILISTGGSGGHVIPATVLYDHLKNDATILMTTDLRGLKFFDNKKYQIKIINTPKLTSKFFLSFINGFHILFLMLKCIFLLKKKGINILISTGGYMSLPLCFAAYILNIKIYLFEPNMVLGRANSFFLKLSNKIFCYSKEIKKYPKKHINKIVLIDPLLRKFFYTPLEIDKKSIEQSVNILIIGGSQSAELFDTSLNKAIVDISKKYRLKIFHQTKSKNFKNLEYFYKKNNIENKVFTFDDDISDYFSKTNLCITRAGASTLSELTYLNIPYIAIPFRLAKDNHQFYNALFYKNKNCCWLITEEQLNDDLLTKTLIEIIENKVDYKGKKNSMKTFSYQNKWNNINQNIITTINEN